MKRRWVLGVEGGEGIVKDFFGALLLFYDMKRSLKGENNFRQH